VTAARIVVMLLVLGGAGVGGAAEPAGAPPSAGEAASADGESARVTMTQDVAARAGIESVRVERVTALPNVEGFGRVLDPLPLVEALHARAAARSMLALARAEHERVVRLHRDDQNASTRDLENARAVLERAGADAANATARVTLAWGARMDESDALADDLVAGRVAIARVDLPAGEHIARPPATITIASVARPARRLAARVLGPAPTTDPLVQGEAYLVLVGDASLPPGTSLLATVPRDVEPQSGVAVPRAAILWSDGHPLAYVETSPGTFEQRTLALGAPLPGAWLVTDGVVAGERVVTAGAAQLLSSAILGSHPGAHPGAQPGTQPAD
jgi:hypothetical protein